MSARDDHAARVMAGVSEPMCWAALFDEIDRLREMVAAARGLCLRWLDEGPDGLDSLDAIDRVCNYLLVDVD